MRHMECTSTHSDLLGVPLAVLVSVQACASLAILEDRKLWFMTADLSRARWCALHSITAVPCSGRGRHAPVMVAARP